MDIKITGTQLKIIDAFFKVVLDHPDQKITVEMISKQAGMTRENIYHNHFRGTKEIIEKIHDIIDRDICFKFQNFIDSDDTNIGDFLSQVMIPSLYQKKEWLKVLYGTNIDPLWPDFLQSRYAPLVEAHLDKIGKNDLISNFFLSQIIVKEFIAIVSVWLTDNNPEPPSLFKEKFIHILQQSPLELLSQR